MFREWGVDADRIPVYPDLAFALPTPPLEAGDPNLVCVGVMDYRGNDHDRGREEEVLAAYVEETTRFVQWLLTTGRDVRLLVGDVNGSDDDVVRRVRAGIEQRLPELEDGRLTARPAISLDDILAAMSPAGTVVALRYHNVVAALMLGKPTLAISYGHKQESLMAGAGLAEFCTPARTLDHERLAAQFTELLDRAPGIRQDLLTQKAATQRLLAEQFEHRRQGAAAGRRLAATAGGRTTAALRQDGRRRSRSSSTPSDMSSLIRLSRVKRDDVAASCVSSCSR